MKVTFYLGPGGTHLASRSLIIRRMARAGDDTDPAAVFTNASIANTTTTVTVGLPNNQIYQAIHVDTNARSQTGVPGVLNFHTGDLSYPGPFTDRLSILDKQTESSSSSSESSSSWSSTSESSSQSSSSQSTSSSSLSSQSTSSSSLSSQSTSSSSSSLSSSSPSESSESSGSSGSTSSVSSSSQSPSSQSSSSWST